MEIEDNTVPKEISIFDVKETILLSRVYELDEERIQEQRNALLNSPNTWSTLSALIERYNLESTRLLYNLAREIKYTKPDVAVSIIHNIFIAINRIHNKKAQIHGN